MGLGRALGDRWREAERYEHLFECALLAAVVGGLLWFVWRRWRAHGR